MKKITKRYSLSTFNQPWREIIGYTETFQRAYSTLLNEVLFESRVWHRVTSTHFHRQELPLLALRRDSVPLLLFFYGRHMGKPIWYSSNDRGMINLVPCLTFLTWNHYLSSTGQSSRSQGRIGRTSTKFELSQNYYFIVSKRSFGYE